MDSCPPEILSQIFSSLQFADKHVVKRVNRHWNQTAIGVVPKHKRLTVYQDDAGAAADMNGITVKRLLTAIRADQVSVFAGITDWDLKAAIQPKGERRQVRPVRLTKDQCSTLLRVIAPNLVKLGISRCDVMKGIIFPSLEEIDCSESVREEIPGSVLQKCPSLTKLAAGAIMSFDLDGMTRLTDLRAEVFIGLMDPFSELVNLKHLSATTTSGSISNHFFAKMHNLLTVSLTFVDNVSVYNEDDDDDDDDDLSFDEGVRLLLENNQNLREIELRGFPLTDQSLVFFRQYICSHGLEKLTLELSEGMKFSIDEIVRIRAAGSKSKLQHLSLLTDEPDMRFVFDLTAGNQ